MKRFLLAGIACLLILMQGGAQDLLWSDVTDTNLLYLGTNVITDESGNVFVGATGNNTAYILQYDKDGMPMLAAGSSDEASYGAMARDADDRLLLAGRQKNGTHWDAMIMVFDAGGNPEFTQWHDFSNKDDRFLDLLTDDSRNIYACGSSYNAGTEQCGLVARYAPDGTPAWIEHYSKPGHHISFSSVRIDDQGNLHVVGRKGGTSPGPVSLLSLVYSADGVLLSEYDELVSGYYEAHPTFSLLDDAGNHYIGGYLLDAGAEISFLMKLANNATAWLQLGNAGVDNVYYNGCLTPGGNIACCGEISNSSADGLYCLYSPGGGLIAEKSYNNPYGDDDVLLGAAADDEHIYFCGMSVGLGTAGDVLVLKLNEELETMWEIRYNSFASDHEYAGDLTIDHEGNVILAGSSIGSGGYQLGIWKFSNPLAIDEQANQMLFTNVYPNPADRHISFFLNELPGEVNYEVYSMEGRIVDSGTLKSSGEQHIDISGLAAGTYMLRLYADSGMFGARFVKK